MEISKTYNEKLVIEDIIHDSWYDMFLLKSNVPPSIFIIGAQKGGTTSLASLLSQHPKVIMPKRKEHYFFSNENYYRKGINWYLKQFKSSTGSSKLNFDASANYLESPIAAALIKKCFPDARIIVLLRNPADRAYSHYKMALKYGFENQSFEKALELENERLRYSMSNYQPALGHDYGMQRLGYRAKGVYADQISNWMKHFSSDQFYVVQSESFFNDTQKEMNGILSFIDTEEFQFDSIKFENKGTGEVMKDETRVTLEAFYEPYNDQLFSKLNKRFDW